MYAQSTAAVTQVSDLHCSLAATHGMFVVCLCARGTSGMLTRVCMYTMLRLLLYGPAMSESEAQLRYEVVGIARTRVIFSTRPKPVLVE